MCSHCQRVHPADCVRRLERFTGVTVARYKATIPGAPERPTRTEAEADWCAHHTRSEP